MANYLKSEQVRVYPSAYRGYTSDTNVIINPEARIPSEYNVTKQTFNVADTFVVKPSFAYNTGWQDTDAINELVFVIHGYCFTITNFKIADLGLEGSSVYATIRLEDKNTTADFDPLTDYANTCLAPYASGNQRLDEASGDDYEFKGLYFSDTLPTTALNTYSIKLFELRADSKFYIVKSSYIKIDSYNISNIGSDEALDECFSTDKIQINNETKTLELTVKDIPTDAEETIGKITENTFEFNKDIELSGDSNHLLGPGGALSPVVNFDTRGFTLETYQGAYVNHSTDAWSLRSVFKDSQGDIAYMTDLGTDGFTIDVKAGHIEDYFTDTPADEEEAKNILSVTKDGIQMKVPVTANSNITTASAFIGKVGAPFANKNAGYFTNLTISPNSPTDITAVDNIKINGTGQILVNAAASFAPCIKVANGYVEAQYFNATSDRRLKENIEEFQYNKSILDLPVVEFNFKGNKEKHIGCIAQDLQELYPNLVHEDKDGYLSIEENKLVYLLLEEVKKLREEINKLKGE